MSGYVGGGLSYDYAEWLRKLDEYPAANTDAPRVNLPNSHCKAAHPIRLTVGDFSTLYDSKVPPAEFQAAVKRVQRGAPAAPFCAFEGKPAELYWRRIGQEFFAHWVCPGCAAKFNTMPYGMWIPA